MRTFIALLISFTISAIAKAQIITTIAGTGVYGYNGDNIPATDASMSGPVGICIDTSGNIYFADRSNNRIRKISTTGIITTIAGNSIAGTVGDGGSATSASLWGPAFITMDANQNLFISEPVGDYVRKINTDGIITTITGDGAIGYTGDGGPATAARINGPSGLALDNSGSLYFSDFQNNRIRKITKAVNATTFKNLPKPIIRQFHYILTSNRLRKHLGSNNRHNRKNCTIDRYK